MKKYLIALAFLLPMVSFAAPLTPPQRLDILKELAVLEAELQALESQVSHVPMFGSIEATSTPVATSTPFYTNNIPFKDNAGDTDVPIKGTNCVREYSRANPEGGMSCGG